MNVENDFPEQTPLGQLIKTHLQIWYFFQILYCFLEIPNYLSFVWWFRTIVSIDTENSDRAVVCTLVSQYSYIICHRQATNLVLIHHQFSHAYCILSLEQQFFYCTFYNSFFLRCKMYWSIERYSNLSLLKRMT